MNGRVRHILACCVLLCTVLSVHGSLVARVLFELRQEHIAEHHCENRFVPGSTCDGLCFLKKRMAEAEHHEHERHAPQVVAPLLIFVTTGDMLLLPRPAPTVLAPVPDAPWRSDPHEAGIDHPPRLS